MELSVIENKVLYYLPKGLEADIVWYWLVRKLLLTIKNQGYIMKFTLHLRSWTFFVFILYFH